MRGPSAWVRPKRIGIPAQSHGTELVTPTDTVPPPRNTDATAGLEVYLVGGAVRDRLLGLTVVERDFVVVGATADDLIRRGFQQVGRDFPVFLHPDSKDEYALARTERKIAPGYRGFAVHADPDVTLEEDLLRRDLTINALAESPDGRLTDPFGGIEDLKNRVLRHVSPAFSEDPVRILRVARFAARFANQGFRVADETLGLMRDMVAAGEVDALVPERVWAELAKALGEVRPSPFFEVLRSCGALARLIPELDRLWGVPQPVKWHPEIDTGVHAMMVVDIAARISPDLDVRFAALCHDLGKGTTPADILPSHRGHEERSVALLETLCDRFRVPNRSRELARIVARYHGLVHKVDELRPATVLGLLEGSDAFRRPERFRQMLLACEADFRGRTGYEELPYPKGEILRQVQEASSAVDVGAIAAAASEPRLIPEHIRRARVAAIRLALAGARDRD
jgi:tRNA nucleotidyltransferase (CCA-adding enzyme)